MVVCYKNYKTPLHCVSSFVLQKAHKRGMSVKKTKRKRDYTSMKAIGVKSIDETFKVQKNITAVVEKS